MKKYVFFILLFLLMTNIKAIEYKEYSKGEAFNYNGVEFYVLEDSDYTESSLLLLKKTPLTLEEVNTYGAGFVNKYADNYQSQVNGYGNVAFKTVEPVYTNKNCIVKKTDDVFIEGYDCADSISSSDVMNIIKNWTEDKFDISDLSHVANGNKYGILSDDVLINSYGYVKNSEQDLVKPEQIPNWLFNETYSYWVSNAKINGIQKPDRAIMMNDGTVVSYTSYKTSSNSEEDNSYYEMATVRPVIRIEKDANTSNLSSNIKSLNSSTFKTGDIVEYNGVRYYVLNNVSKKDPVLKLLKQTPLTVEELNKFSRSINRYTVDSVNEAKNINGYGGMAYLSRNKCKNGLTTSCTTKFNSSDIIVTVKNWVASVTNEGDLYEDQNGFTARILNKDDVLQNLGYINNESSNDRGGKATLLTPEFLLNLSNCWTMFVCNDSDQVYKISRSGNLIPSDVYNNDNVVCPVINFIRPGYEVVPSTNTGMKKTIVYAIIGIVITLIASGVYLLEKLIAKKRLKQSH